MPKPSRIAVVEEKLDKFLTNDWPHMVKQVTVADVKLNVMLAIVGLVVAGIFVPLAIKLWSAWLP